MESQISGTLDLKDVILYSPFEKRSDRSLFFNSDCGEFIEFCYVEPDFGKTTSELNKKMRESSNVHDRETLHEELSNLRAKETAKKKFEEGLDSPSNNPIYIRGFSGTGKTTYIKTLLYKKYQNLDHVTCEEFDINDSADDFSILSKKWRNKNHTRTLYKFISILMETLGKRLEYKKSEHENEHKQRMKLMLDNYYEFFFKRSLRICTNVFSIIEEYLKKEIRYNTQTLNERDENTFCIKMYNEIVAYYPENNDSSEIAKAISELLELIIVLLTCSHSSENISTNNFRNFLFFDNIENFIRGDQVYNEDINTISKIFYDFVNSMTKKFDGFRQFSYHFKFILAVRDTTEKMIDKVNLQRQDGDSLVQLNVSTWFPLDEIAQKKIDYFKTKKFIPNSSATIESIDTILAIFKDSTPNDSGLRDILSKMYNHNKRRIISYLLEALPEHPGCTNDYYNLWNIALNYDKKHKELSKATSKNVAHITEEKCMLGLTRAYKNAARQIILRILLDLIVKCGYFDKIYASDGLGLARKLITNLHGHFPLNIMEDESDNLGYIDFHTLLKPILSSPVRGDVTDNHEIIKVIAKILYNMNSSAREDTKWCQLVDIKFNQHEFNIEELADKLLGCYQNNENNKRQYAIKITEAGRYFLESIIPSFEYFACRYNKNSSPLFSSYNLGLIKTDSKEPSNHAIEHMKTMKEKIFKRIDYVIKQDIIFFTANQSVDFKSMYSSDDIRRPYCYASPTRKPLRNEKCHPLRILHSHIGYFDNYRAFILTIKDYPYYSNNIKDYTDDIKEGLSRAILDIIKSYVDKLQDLIENRIREDGKIIEGSPYIGEKNIKNEKDKCKIYRDKLNKAKASPCDCNIRIETDW